MGVPECFPGEKKKCPALIRLFAEYEAHKANYKSNFFDLKSNNSHFKETVEKKVDQCVKSTNEATIAAGQCIKYSELCYDVAQTCKDTLKQSTKTNWIKWASSIVVFIGTMATIVMIFVNHTNTLITTSNTNNATLVNQSNENNRKLVGIYKESVDKDLETQNKNQERLENEFKKINKTLINVLSGIKNPG